jgi:hypothetical protein
MNNQTQMVGTATLNLMAFTQNAKRFQNLLHPETIIDAKVSFLTCEGETITVDVMEFLELNWTTHCPETGELLEVI